MKISPLAQAGTPGAALGSVDVGRTASPEKMERARAIARGEAPKEATDPQAERIQNTRKITMRTNHTTNRDEVSAEVADPAPEAQSSTEDAGEPGVVADTQPISPQLAAIAKAKRALQVKERELLEREKALVGKVPQEDGTKALIDRIKAKPLSVLQEHGVTYDQLTEAILSGSDGINPDIQALKAEIQALKEGVDKSLVDRDAQQKKAALAEMRREADRLAADGEAYELVRATGSVPKVLELIEKTYDESGEVLDVSEALQLVEEDLVEQSLKLAASKKVQGKLSAPALQTQPPKSGMRTLTAAGTSSAQMSARARAIAAFNGTLRK